MSALKPKLDDIEAFLALAEALNYTGAAAQLGLSKSVVTRRIQRLEETLRTQLVERTTRRLKLTQEGQLYYRDLHKISQILARAGERLQRRLERPVGHIKVVLPSYLGSSVVTRSVVPAFLDAHPEVSLEIRLSDLGPFDLPKDFDLLVMTRLSQHRLPDSALRERKLGRLSSGVFVAPAYLTDAPRPETPNDLLDHRCLSYLGRQWRFTTEDGTSTVVEVNGPLITGSNEVLKSAVISGQGIAYSFLTVFEEELESGMVVPILEPWTAGSGLDLRMLLPGQDYTPLRVQLFADALSQALARPGESVT